MTAALWQSAVISWTCAHTHTKYHIEVHTLHSYIYIYVHIYWYSANAVSTVHFVLERAIPSGMRPHLGLCSVWLGYNRFPQCNLIKIDAWREHRCFAEVFVHWRRHTWRMRNVLLSRVVSVQVECWMPLINCLLLCSVSTFFLFLCCFLWVCLGLCSLFIFNFVRVECVSFKCNCAMIRNAKRQAIFTFCF